MHKLRIAICDDSAIDARETEERCICTCVAGGIPFKVDVFTTLSEFLFEMQGKTFLTRLDLLIVEPAGCFSTVGEIVRGKGYDGQILYLSHSRALKHFTQAFDIDADNYVIKDTTMRCRYPRKRPPQSCTCRFREVLELSIAQIKKCERRYIALNCHGEYKQIKLKNILYFQGTGNHQVMMRYNNGECAFPGSLREMEDLLPRKEFVRPHRSYIVALRAITQLDSTELTLCNGQKIPVSRSGHSELKTMLERYYQTAEVAIV